MQYLFLIYGSESKRPETPKSPEELAAYMAPWQAYGKALTEAGVMLGSNALQGVATATTISATSGETLITDGPFAETKEQLGGYYLVECDDLDSALQWAAKCPVVQFGRVEVRPIQHYE